MTAAYRPTEGGRSGTAARMTDVTLEFHSVILQPTSLCNLDCSYCYLPTRKTARFMAEDVADAVADGLAALGRPVNIIWHGGEPLVAGTKRLRRLLQPFNESACRPYVRHSLQTNATLITDDWCDVFDEFNVQLGVSIDGPEYLNRERRTLTGGTSFSAASKGIATLKRRNLPFGLIAVVGPHSLGHASALYDFAVSIRCTTLCVNIEETEGCHRSTIQNDAMVREFWRDLLGAWSRNPAVPVRELRRALQRLDVFFDDARHKGRIVDIRPSIACNGDVVVLAPELLSDSHFVVGNVLHTALADIILASRTADYVTDYLDGIRTCAAECEYFAFCGSTFASNRYSEHGRLNVSETAHCRRSVQYVVDALLQNDRSASERSIE